MITAEFRPKKIPKEPRTPPPPAPLSFQKKKAKKRPQKNTHTQKQNPKPNKKHKNPTTTKTQTIHKETRAGTKKKSMPLPAFTHPVKTILGIPFIEESIGGARGMPGKPRRV